MGWRLAYILKPISIPTAAQPPPPWCNPPPGRGRRQPQCGPAPGDLVSWGAASPPLGELVLEIAPLTPGHTPRAASAFASGRPAVSPATARGLGDGGGTDEADSDPARLFDRCAATSRPWLTKFLIYPPRRRAADRLHRRGEGPKPLFAGQSRDEFVLPPPQCRLPPPFAESAAVIANQPAAGAPGFPLAKGFDRDRLPPGRPAAPAPITVSLYEKTRENLRQGGEDFPTTALSPGVLTRPCSQPAASGFQWNGRQAFLLLHSWWSVSSTSLPRPRPPLAPGRHLPGGYCSSFRLRAFSRHPPSPGRLFCGTLPQTVPTPNSCGSRTPSKGDHQCPPETRQAPLSAGKMTRRQPNTGSGSPWRLDRLPWSLTSPRQGVDRRLHQLDFRPLETFWIFFYAGFHPHGRLHTNRSASTCAPTPRGSRASCSTRHADRQLRPGTGNPATPAKGHRPSRPRAGDCIDCGVCVQVCPTGIDIRRPAIQMHRLRRLHRCLRPIMDKGAPGPSSATRPKTPWPGTSAKGNRRPHPAPAHRASIQPSSDRRRRRRRLVPGPSPAAQGGRHPYDRSALAGKPTTVASNVFALHFANTEGAPTLSHRRHRTAGIGLAGKTEVELPHRAPSPS